MDVLGALTGPAPDSTGSGAGPGAGPVTCSARGCRRPAVWALRWNNPKLHGPERRKVWTACDEHREHLADFLRLRGFLREIEPLEGSSS